MKCSAGTFTHLTNTIQRMIWKKKIKRNYSYAFGWIRLEYFGRWKCNWPVCALLTIWQHNFEWIVPASHIFVKRLAYFHTAAYTHWNEKLVKSFLYYIVVSFLHSILLSDFITFSTTIGNRHHTTASLSQKLQLLHLE